MLPGAFFSPRSVAVVGASRDPGKVGHGVFVNLLRAGFAGEVHGVNPSGGEILGRTLLRSIEEIPGPVDLGVLAVPPPAVVAAIPRLAARGMKAAVVISAGFRETGPLGAALERELREAAVEAGVRVLGPNCLGLIDTRSRLNATFAAGMPPRGSIAFFSQSGALCAAVLDWAIGAGVGFSTFVSLGNEADVTESDVVEHLARDGETRVVLGYVESISDGRRFIDVARAATAAKPLVLVKAGGTAAGARAASSHTGSLAGSDRAYAAAFRQSGVLRAETVEELFDLARAFSMQPLPPGDRLLVVTNAGGPGILAADAAERLGIPLPEPTRRFRQRLAAALPHPAAVANPLDLIGDARGDRYRVALSAARDEVFADAVLVLLTPQAMTEPEETARAAVSTLAGSGKTVLASFLGEATVAPARRILAAGGIPDYPVPERAVRALGGMIAYRRARSAPRGGPSAVGGTDRAAARRAVLAALAAGKRALGEDEARSVLEAYGFVFPRHAFARTGAEAAEAFARLGGRAAMKIVSPDVLHKTEVGGVRLGVASPAEAAEAFTAITASVRRAAPSAWIAGVSVQEMVEGGRELIVGMSRDPQFGPLVMFGLGGVHVEVLRDVSFRVAPLSCRDASEMVREIRAYPLLAGFRGAEPADEGAIVEALLRVSALAADVPEIQEIDINPLIAFPRGRGVRAVDGRMAVAEASG